MIFLQLSFNLGQVPLVFLFSIEVNLFYTLKGGSFEIKISDCIPHTQTGQEF